jgi:RNA polymerase subunit RPABC4/transcription elongation factor Spt4
VYLTFAEGDVFVATAGNRDHLVSMIIQQREFFKTGRISISAFLISTQIVPPPTLHQMSAITARNRSKTIQEDWQDLFIGKIITHKESSAVAKGLIISRIGG